MKKRLALPFPELPTEINEKIFRYLRTAFLIRNARLVNHDWQTYIDHVFAKRIMKHTLRAHIPTFFYRKRDNVRYRKRIYDVKQLSGGMTNQTYLFKTRKHRFIARIPGRSTHNFIDRASEAYNNRVVFSAGIAPKPILEKSDGTAITAYLPHPKPLSCHDFKHTHTIKAAAKILRQLHEIKRPMQNDIDVFYRNRIMKDILRQHRVEIPPALITIESSINQIEKMLFRIPRRRSPCHNDTTPSNFIVTKGRLKLIDFEYAGNNDPIWDLACLAIEAKLSNRRSDKLLNYYFNRQPTDIETLRFKLYLPVVEYWVVLWSKVQLQNTYTSRAKHDLRNMLDDRMTHCQELLAKPFYQSLLNPTHQMIISRLGNSI